MSDKDKKKQPLDVNRTKLIKDRVMPALRSEGHAAKGALIAGTGAALLGTGASLAGGKAMAQVAKKVGAPKEGGKLWELATNPKLKKARLAIGATSSAISAMPAGAKTGRVLGDMRDLEKKSRKELGREPSEKEYKEVARLNDNNALDRRLGRMINTPNAMVKSEVRKAQQQKTASEILAEELIKEAGEFREQCKARQKYLKQQRKKQQQKTASEVLAEELIKEASIVTHASKAVNGIKRAGQLLTGSHANGLKKSLKTMQNASAGTLKDSLKTGEQMMLTQKALNKEASKVRATRLGVAGVGLAGAKMMKTKQQESNIPNV